MEFEKELREWTEKVINAYNKSKEEGGMCHTYKMIKDVDKIIAQAFGHDEVIRD